MLVQVQSERDVPIGGEEGGSTQAKNPAAVVRWESFVARAGQRVFTISDPAATFAMIFCDDRLLFAVSGDFVAKGRTIKLAAPAQQGQIIMVGYQPASPEI